ncbi:MAG: hypothetical protein KC964_20710, partial [Candidatus Omnitrophica bacterium]|nr:hypothetical protein [Candidatus Omnitrophota bacterium]
YRQQFADLSEKMGFELEWEPSPIGRTEQFQQLANRIETTKPDGVLLAAFKKTVWQSHGKDLLEAISPPCVVLAPLGVLLIPSVVELEEEPGACMISSSNPLQDVEMPLRMLGANVLMAESVILNLQGDNREEEIRVPGLNTRVRTVPRQTYIDVYQAMRDTDEVRDLARDYLGRAVEVVEPNEADVLDAAKSYFALKKVLESENADALMMDCLPGLKFPHQHVPPCMGFMSLRDEGIVAGCESDLDATLTLMLLQNLFGTPGFQHNPAVDTEKNHYFCAHCTSASRMRGLDQSPEPIALRSHAEAGWGCVPRVLFSENQDVTISKYLHGDSAQLLLYSGTVLRCPPIPPAGGCRTNAEIKLNELENVADLKGHHLCMVYGNHTRDLRRFCQLNAIEVVV